MFEWVFFFFVKANECFWRRIRFKPRLWGDRVATSFSRCLGQIQQHTGHFCVRSEVWPLKFFHFNVAWPLHFYVGHVNAVQNFPPKLTRQKWRRSFVRPASSPTSGRVALMKQIAAQFYTLHLSWSSAAPYPPAQELGPYGADKKRKKRNLGSILWYFFFLP